MGDGGTGPILADLKRRWRTLELIHDQLFEDLEKKQLMSLWVNEQILKAMLWNLVENLLKRVELLIKVHEDVHQAHMSVMD